jgi:branched-chain amino acid transport system substrate-binding protein
LKRLIRLLVVAASAIVVLSAGITGRAETLDDDPAVVSEYARGKRLLREEDYLEASRVFRQLSEQNPESPNLDLFVFNQAKAEFHLGNFAQAESLFLGFVSHFTSSPCLPHARFFLGNTYYLRGNLDKAVAAYIEAYGESKDSRLSDLVVQSLTDAIAGATSVRLSASLFENLSLDRRCALTGLLADSLAVRQKYQVARELAAICGRTIAYPDSASVPSASEIGPSLDVAVMLPFSGEMQTYGEEIYNGAVVAAEVCRSEGSCLIRLTPYDTEGDPVNAARILGELLRGPTDAVVGPLTSEEATVSAAALSCGTLPMIAPAATEAGLTMLSTSCFQLSPNVELQGIRMADYAVFNLKADSAAVITPTDRDSLRRTRAFTSRFKELGGTIAAVEYCRPRDRDYGAYLKDIKAILIGVHSDSSFFINDNGDTLDPEAVPASIDCLYLPGEPDQLRQLLPQIKFYNLTAAYLGSDGWGDESVYRLGDDVTRGAVFPSPYLQQRHSEEYVKFAAAYDRRFGKQPQRLASLGYDAVMVIAHALRAGATTREELLARLGAIGKYEGAAAVLTFGDHRENVELPIYQIVDGTPVYLGGGRTIQSENRN